MLKKNLIKTSNRFFQSKAGILGLEYYVPNKFVNQTELEKFDDVSEGNYVIGLGQKNLAFVDDREDSVSIMMTALDRLLDNYDIKPEEIGALYVGTETSVDRSKSIKSYLMELFNLKYGYGKVRDLEGVDSINACFGGTQALFDSLYFVESHFHNPSSKKKGKYAIVVCGDCAAYKERNARPTQGVGAVAMLIGENGTLQCDINKKQFHMDHVYDFYKPDPTCIYPIVQGQFSNACYLGALDKCYSAYRGEDLDIEGDILMDGTDQQIFNIYNTDYMLFHSPYNKLLQKSVGFLQFIDYLNNEKNLEKIIDYLPEKMQSNKEEIRKTIIELKEEMKNKKRSDLYTNKKVLDTFRKYSSHFFEEKTSPGSYMPTNIGNSYTSSIYISLCSLIHEIGTNLENKNILMFSYGSGLASGLYEMKVADKDQTNKFSLSNIQKTLDVENRMNSRIKFDPEYHLECDKQNFRNYGKNLKNFNPTGDIETLEDGTFYLDSIDEDFRRVYKQK